MPAIPRKQGLLASLWSVTGCAVKVAILIAATVRSHTGAAGSRG
jgi:hypothetical protein